MKVFSGIFSCIFLIAAMLGLWMHDPAFSLACCAMSGLCRLDAQFEELKEEKKK